MTDEPDTTGTETVEMTDPITAERDRLAAALADMVMTAADEEIEHIARADPEAGRLRYSKYLASLKTVIFKRGCRMTEKHIVQPGEVLAIVAEDTEPRPGRTFEIATAILMVNALHDGDADGAMSICWELNGPRYSETDPTFRPLLLAGFRWLANNAIEWEYMQGDDVAPIPQADDVPQQTGQPQPRTKAAPAGLN